MKILQVYRDLFPDPPGGIERHVHQLAHHLGDDFSVDVLISARSLRSSVALEDGVRVIRAAEFGRPGGVPLCPSFLRSMSEGYDVVHIHSPNPTAELANLVVGRRTVSMATYHADIDRGARLMPVYARLLVASLSRCKVVLATSERLVESSPILSRLRTRGIRIEIVPLGVDTEEFSPSSQPGEGQRLRVLALGRLRYYKGFDVLIEAMSGLEADLWIAGDGPERDRLESLARANLPSTHRFLGDVPEHELAAVYRSATLFCLPSLSHAEAFGTATLEAMACGLPVITTEVGTGTSVLNRAGVTGLIVPPGDPAALRSALSGLLLDREARSAMGEAARARALTFSRAVMVERIASLYDEIGSS